MITNSWLDGGKHRKVSASGRGEHSRTVHASVRTDTRGGGGEEETEKEGTKREKRWEGGDGGGGGGGGGGGTGRGRERGRLKCERRASDDGVIRVGSTQAVARGTAMTKLRRQPCCLTGK